MMVKRKLDGAVDESSVDQDICESDVVVHNLGKSGGPALSGTWSRGRQAD